MNGSQSHLLKARPPASCAWLGLACRPRSVKSSCECWASQGPVEAEENVRTGTSRGEAESHQALKAETPRSFQCKQKPNVLFVSIWPRGEVR